MSASAVDYHRPNEDVFHSYEPAQKPESKNNKNSPRRLPAADSPDGTTTSLNGRKRARTKVVAWDPEDLEEIYRRKEINRENWDAICKDYPSRTRVAMRQQVIKLRDKKQREAAGNNHEPKPSSTYLNSPQASSPSNVLRWATVNGSSPANGEAYHRARSMGDEESAEEDYLSSAPESDYDTPVNRHFEQPARSTLLQTHPHPAPEGPPAHFVLPSTPAVIQEAPQSSTQHPSEFDLVAAQSRGKPIAPRQPPMPQSLPVEIPNDGHSHHLPPQPPPPDLRSTQRLKRGRDVETNGILDPRSDSHLGKRRKHPAGPVGAPPIQGITGVMGGTGEGPIPLTNPATSHPMLPTPSRIPRESDLDNLCTQVRDMFRNMKAGYEEEQRARHELYEAALGRANARVVQYQRKIDDISEESAARLKDLSMSRKLESEHREHLYDSLQAENLKVRSEYTRVRDLNAQIREEIARKDEQIAALSAALEQEKMARVSEPSDRPEEKPATMAPALKGVEEKIQAAEQNAQRADDANDLLAEKIKRLRTDHIETRRKFAEAEAVHESLTATLEEFAAQDFEALRQKEIKKTVSGVKEAGQQLTSKFKEVNAFLNGLKYLGPGDTQQPKEPVDDPPISQDKPA
ncbi:MAG: hypothetical protein Q9207_004173 [Kuettlingeria erythrocarpa]